MEAKSIERQLEDIRQLKSAHLSLGEKILRAHSSALYEYDFFAVAVIKRSMSLIAGFTAMVEQRNYICAAPLLRMQLDNCLRLHAAYISPNIHQFTVQVMSGQHIRKLKDVTGNKMNDAYLVQSLGAEYKWLEGVYQELSGFVHLSDRHIFITKDEPDGEGPHRVVVTDHDRHLPDRIFTGAIQVFMAATGIVFQYLEGWAWVKEHPDLARELKAMAENKARTP